MIVGIDQLINAARLNPNALRRLAASLGIDHKELTIIQVVDEIFFNLSLEEKKIIKNKKSPAILQGI